MIPRSQLVSGVFKAKFDELAAEVKALAARETNTSPDDWVVRPALPSVDFDHNKDKWENQTAFGSANAFQKDWKKELPQNKYVVFYGVVLHADSPTIYAAKFKLGTNGATTLAVEHFEALKEEDNRIAVFDRVLYKQKSYIYIELEADATTAQYGEEFELLCLVCEKVGETVSVLDRTSK